MSGSFSPARLARISRARPVSTTLATTAIALSCLVGPSTSWAARSGGSTDPQTGNFVVYVYPEGHFSRESDIQKVLAGWASAAASNNADTESRFYAPEVDRYFLRRNVSNAFVRHDKEALRDRGYDLRSFSISDVNIDLSSDTEASVWLVKSWVMAGGSSSQHANRTHSRLTLRLTSSGWKITGEQDLKAVQSAALPSPSGQSGGTAP